jgi:hypothetical protein
LDVAAIFRPSIIVGDSLTGYSSTFHGFYTPLRLVCALQTQLSHERVFETDHMAMMGLSGNEGKNFVPVEWVSQAIVSIIERSPDSSRTYALASMSPVTSARLMEVFRAVTRRLAAEPASPKRVTQSSLNHSPSDPILAAYLEQLHTYRSYWRNDPVFDCSNTVAALPDLPCPILSDEVLIRLSEWAVKSKFTAPLEMRRQHAHRGWIQTDRDQQPAMFEGASPTARVITITGRGGGSWTIDGKDLAGQMCVWEGRLAGAPELCISNDALERIFMQETTLNEAADAGDVVTIGRASDLDSWRGLLAAARTQSIFKGEV